MLHAIFRIASQQHGVFSLGQARAVGLTSSWCTRQCRRGLIERRARGVYVVVGAPPSRRQHLLVHVLAAGPAALATADSGLGLWCRELALPAKPIVAATRSCGYRPTEAQLRRSTDLHLAKPTVIDGIPVVGLVRALLDASAGRTVEEVLTLIDACRRHSSLAAGALIEALHAHQRRGRPGIDVFRRAVCRLGDEVPDSDFERWVLRDLAEAGVPAPRLHHVVRIASEEPITLDLDWVDPLVNVELDGADHVRRSRKIRRDRTRDRLLQAQGYEVLRYGWEDYAADRAGMLAEIARFVSGVPAANS